MRWEGAYRLLAPLLVALRILAVVPGLLPFPDLPVLQPLGRQPIREHFRTTGGHLNQSESISEPPGGISTNQRAFQKNQAAPQPIREHFRSTRGHLNQSESSSELLSCVKEGNGQGPDPGLDPDLDQQKRLSPGRTTHLLVGRLLVPEPPLQPPALVHVLLVLLPLPLLVLPGPLPGRQGDSSSVVPPLDAVRLQASVSTALQYIVQSITDGLWVKRMK